MILMAINYTELEQALRSMNERSRLYEIVKAEMQSRGRWKAKPRGQGFKPGFDPKRKPLKPAE